MVSTPHPKLGFLSRISSISFPAPHMDLMTLQVAVTRPWADANDNNSFNPAIPGPSITFQKTITGTPYKISGDVAMVPNGTGNTNLIDQTYTLVTGNSGGLPAMTGVAPFTAPMVKKVYSWTTVPFCMIKNPGSSPNNAYNLRCYLLFNLTLISKAVASPFEFTLSLPFSSWGTCIVIAGLYRSLRAFIVPGTNLLSAHGGITPQPGSNMGWPDANMVYHASGSYTAGSAVLSPFFAQNVTRVVRVSVNLANYVTTITSDTTPAPTTFSASGAPGPD